MGWKLGKAKQYDWILWDWNGTLIDDLQIALDCVNLSLHQHGKNPITVGQYQQYMDSPIIRFYEQIFDLNQVPFSELAREYHENYAKAVHPGALMEGAEEILQKIGKAGITQVILSSYAQEELLSYVQLLGVDRYFAIISGAEDYRAAEKITRGKELLSVHQIDPERVLVIGDALPDYEVARELGTDVILIAKGHQSRQDLKACGVPVLEDIREVEEYIKPRM